MKDNKTIIRNMIIENIKQINSRLNKINNEEFYNSKIIELYNEINCFDENSINFINNALTSLPLILAISPIFTWSSDTGITPISWASNPEFSIL